jgi:hypothetical protein
MRVANHSYPFVLPDRWLGYFQQASAIVTPAFHGVMYALKYQRPFLAIPSRGKEVKISDALNAYGLGDRLVEEPPRGNEQLTAENLFKPYDVASHVEPRIASSWDYLRRALDGQR